MALSILSGDETGPNDPGPLSARDHMLIGTRPHRIECDNKKREFCRWHIVYFAFVARELCVSGYAIEEDHHDTGERSNRRRDRCGLKNCMNGGGSGSPRWPKRSGRLRSRLSEDQTLFIST